MLQLSNITVGVGKKTVLEEISYLFKKNKIYAVMGPNGSGKSTLAFAIMGHPAYEVKQGAITFCNKDITEESTHKRSEMGIFLSFQSPLSLAGVKIHQLLQFALEKKKSALEIRKKIQQVASDLNINEDLLRRSLNDGASGGEKKKMEVLQASILDKELQIFDEVDTGVDVDSLRTIAGFLNKRKKGKTYIVITHYNRILRYLKPDNVLILDKGRIKKVGDSSLADTVERDGYDF